MGCKNEQRPELLADASRTGRLKDVQFHLHDLGGSTNGDQEEMLPGIVHHEYVPHRIAICVLP